MRDLPQARRELVEMVEQPYEAEAVLQRLLADYPNLLAGDQDQAPPRHWLLVQRELGIADNLEGADRWSLDHLFLDQDGVPTLVEVKRSSDTRLRREVVGQTVGNAAAGKAAAHDEAGVGTPGELEVRRRRRRRPTRSGTLVREAGRRDAERRDHSDATMTINRGA